jgi:PAS domain S-box-containing protein
MAKKVITIFLIEDDEDDYILLKKTLNKISKSEYVLTWEKNSDRAMKAIAACSYDVYIVDFRLGKRTGMDILKDAKRHGCNKPFILLTGSGNEELGVNALRAGAQDYLTKGEITPVVLERAIRYAIERTETVSREQDLIAEQTARKIAEAQRNKLEDVLIALEDHQERLELAQKAGNIGTFEWNIQTGGLVWTPELQTLYGLSMSNTVETFKQWQRMIHPEDRKQVEEEVQKALKENLQMNTEFRVVWPDKSVHWIYAKGTVFTDKHQKPLRMVGVNMDITARKQLENQKDEFIGVATHELKTPITTLKGYTQVLINRLKKKKDFSTVAHLTKMDVQLNRLNTLVEDLLDVTKIQSGTLQLNREDIIFSDLVAEIVDSLQLTTDRHTIVMKNNLKKKVHADRNRIGQVITNILSNAIKYSPQANEIIVTMDNKDSVVTLSVQDFGIGISDDVQKKVFDRFFRVSGPTGVTFPGLGLGLFISAEIIRRHGGKIWVESKIGKGSTFSFSLPVNKKTENRN